MIAPYIADLADEAAEGLCIVLPWPDKRLSPNARLHWRSKVGPKQSARIAAQHATVAAKGFWSARKALEGSEGPIPVRVTFYPPDRRHRDDDNMIGAFKHARDGIAEMLRVDDRRFRPHYVFADPEKPGRVEVVLVRCWRNDRRMIQAFVTWGAMIVRFDDERLSLGVEVGVFEQFSARGLPAYRLTEKGQELARKNGIAPDFGDAG